MGTIKNTSDLRNQAAALLAGLDAHRVEPFTNFGASSVAFDPKGKRLLIGGLGDAAKLWDGNTGKLEILSQTNSESLTFADGAPMELRYDLNSRLLVLRDLLGPRVQREWRIPEQINSIKVGTNVPVLLAITRDGTSVAGVLPLVDGQQAVVVSHSNTFRPVEVLASPISRLAISPDGSLVAVAQSENRISVWSASGNSRIADLPTERDEILCLTFKRTTRIPQPRKEASEGVWLLAAGDSGGNVTLWDLHTRTTKGRYQGGHYGFSVVAFSPDGTILACGGYGPVKLYDLATEQLLLDINVGGSGEYLTGLDFAPDGKRLAISMQEGNRHPGHVLVFKLEFGRGIQTLRGLSSQISKVCFSADGQQVAALSHDWNIGIWSLATGQLRRVFEVPVGETADNAALAFDPSGQRLAFAASKTAKIWHIGSGAVLRSWPLPPGLADGLAFLDDDHLLLGRLETSDGKHAPFGNPQGVHDPCVHRIRNLLSPDWQRAVTEDPNFNRGVSNIAVSRDGRCFVVEGKQVEAGVSRVMIKAYDGVTGKELWGHPTSRSWPSGAIVFDATGQFVAFQTNDTTNAVLVELASGLPIKPLPWLPAAIGLDGGYYAVSGLGRGFSLFKDVNPIPVVTLGIDGGESAANPQFDPAGNQLAWGNTDGTVTVCNLKEINDRLRRIGLAW